MNNTKWRELTEELTSNPGFQPQVRVKYLLIEAEYKFTHIDWELIWHGDGQYIEWMDIDPIRRDRSGRLVKGLETDFTPWLKQALQKHSIPFLEDDGIFRIYGYLRPNGN